VQTGKTFLSGFLGFGIILLIAFTVNAVLDLSGFESAYRDSLVAQFRVEGEAIKGKIETALNLGKKIYLLDELVTELLSESLKQPLRGLNDSAELEGQIDEILLAVIRKDTGIQNIYVADKDNAILYSSRSSIAQKNIPFYFDKGKDIPEGGGRSPLVIVNFLDANYICIPIYSGNKFFEGTLLIEFSENLIQSYIQKAVYRLIFLVLQLLAIALSLYFLLFRLLPEHKRKETIITVILILSSQLYFSISNYGFYNMSISGMFNKNMSVLAKSIAEELQKPLDYQVRIEDLGRADAYLENRIAGNPHCSDIYITDINLSILYGAHRDDSPESAASEVWLTRQDGDLTMIPLSSIYGNGYLVLRLNRPMINAILNDIALDSGTIIIIALIFAFILKDLLAFIGSLSFLRKRRLNLSANNEEDSLRLIKISTFIFMFAAFVPLSFMPLYIQHIYFLNPVNNSLVNARNATSLPIASYMLGVLAAMFITLFVIKSLSIRVRYAIMALVFIAGSLMTIAKDDIMFLIFARFVAGFGYGGILLSTSSLVMTYTNDKTRGTGFGTNAAAFAAASICSIPIGGIIVNKFGYAAGIWVAIVFALFFLVFSVFCIHPTKRAAEVKQKKETDDRKVTFDQFFRVLASRHVIVYLLCVNIPFQLIYLGLFQFLLPIYMSDTLGLSQGNIGRFLSIFCIVSLGAAFISRFSDRVKNDKLLISIGALCVGIALIAFKLYPAGGFFVFVAVLIAMGLDNVSIDAIEELYLSSGNVPGISEENLLQSYKVIEKIVSVVIPTLTSTIIIYAGFSSSMFIIGIWSVIGAIAFLFFGKNGRWEKKHA
jgi:predicted MFS family arabinose efflux permease